VFSSPARFAAYSVRPGDTWAKIAAAFGVRADELRRLNAGAELVAGESLMIQLTLKRTVRKPAKRSAAPAAPRSSAAAPSARPAAPAAAVRSSP
jgi:spore germination protein YaaH